MAANGTKSQIRGGGEEVRGQRRFFLAQFLSQPYIHPSREVYVFTLNTRPRPPQIQRGKQVNLNNSTSSSANSTNPQGKIKNKSKGDPEEENQRKEKGGLTEVNSSVEAPMNELRLEKRKKTRISQEEEYRVGLRALDLWIHQNQRKQKWVSLLFMLWIIRCDEFRSS